LRETGAGEAACRRRLARPGRAQPLRGRLDAARQRRRPLRGARVARPGRDRRRPGDGIPVPRRSPAMEDATARRPRRPVFLDAECAWWGDPAFDLAFCLNHLLLKCVWTPAAAPGFLACFDALA